VWLYSDGIPGTMPDGQGQFSQFDLGSADHVEVQRGPFASLYGIRSRGSLQERARLLLRSRLRTACVARKESARSGPLRRVMMVEMAFWTRAILSRRCTVGVAVPLYSGATALELANTKFPYLARRTQAERTRSEDT
jgi:hypothetical protein